MSITDKLITIADNTPLVAAAVNAKKPGKNLLSVLTKWGQTPQDNASPIYLEAGQSYTFSFEGEYTTWRLMFYGTQVDGAIFPYPVQSGSYDPGRFIAGCYTTKDAAGTTRLQWGNNLTGNRVVIECREAIIVTAMQFWVTGTELTPFSRFQLEKGNAATAYEPYKDPALYEAALEKAKVIKGEMETLKEELL